MVESELEKLRRRAREDAEKELTKRRDHYRYARELGFSPVESKLLSGASKERIDRLAEEKAEEVAK